mmetsp:Transcript_34530/g.72709  ORF Transcript_34530/g.72709 Transcript_34530/m.72709 type:complete len:285 (+) Transcript_34530:132-986(+)
MRWQIYLLLSLSLLCFSTKFTYGASPTEVFIATTATGPAAHHHATSRSRVKMRSSSVTTATDAAVAMNSIEFIELLSSIKNTADVKTYTQTPSVDCGDDGASTKQWSLASRFFGNDDETTIGNHSSNHDCLPKSTAEAPIHLSKHCSLGISSHETVSEYIGRLWFLPDGKGIKFRETIRILSISADGKSSTVECTTQYQKGSQWIDCSNIICVFSSVPSGAVQRGSGGVDGHNNNTEMKVKMTLDCEVLVWLPLPKAATNQVRKKISSVFETVALDFFEELATN